MTMKKSALALSCLAAASMLVFCFVTFGYFSDSGFVWGAEIPVSFDAPILAIVSDFVYMLAPICALSCAILGFFIKRKALMLPPFGITALYGILRLIYYFSDFNAKAFGASLFSMIALVLLYAAAIFVYLGKAPRAILPLVSLLFFICQAGLLCLSLLTGENLSQFYFGQNIAFSPLSSYFYIRIYLSVMLYQFSFYAFAALFPAALSMKELTPPPSPPEAPAIPEPEEEDAPLSLEDFGIEK